MSPSPYGKWLYKTCMNTSITILVDGDACPVKDEIYKVGLRYQVAVIVVSNGYMRVPQHPLISYIGVSDAFDAADDDIAGRCDDASVVITSDILLAERCLKAGAQVLAPNGRPFTPASIGGAIATRAIMADLRAGGEQIGGSPPFTKKDRSNFLQMLDQMLVKLIRQRR